MARVSSVCYVPTASSACLLDPDLISISHENPSFPHRGESEVFVRLALRITKNFLLWLYVSMWNRLIECWMLLRFLCKIWSMSYFVFFFFFYVNFTMNFYEEVISKELEVRCDMEIRCRLLYEILFSVLLFLFGILIFLKYSIFLCVFFSFFFFFLVMNFYDRGFYSRGI